MGLAKTKQALLRGYAVASMSSQDRTSGPGARCFAWGADAAAAVQLIRWLPKELGLPAGAPVYLDGASSGGSLALRLPLEVDVDGVVGGERSAASGPWPVVGERERAQGLGSHERRVRMRSAATAVPPAPPAEVIAPGDYGRILDDVKARGRRMPPALYIHMPLDECVCIMSLAFCIMSRAWPALARACRRRTPCPTPDTRALSPNTHVPSTSCVPAAGACAPRWRKTSPSCGSATCPWARSR